MKEEISNYWYIFLFIFTGILQARSNEVFLMSFFINQIAKSIAQHAGYNKSHWNADGDALVVTAYFVHPSVICNGTRSKSSYIGENLYIQVGASPKNLMKIPFKESDLKSTKWVKGKCFSTMGKNSCIYINHRDRD